MGMTPLVPSMHVFWLAASCHLVAGRKKQTQNGLAYICTSTFFANDLPEDIDGGNDKEL